MNIERADVAIAGAGPVGLMLATELSLRDVKVVVLERLAQPDETIKAGGIGALAGEALQRRGFGPAMDSEENALTEAMMAMAKRNGAPGNSLQGPSPLNKIGGHFAGLFLIDQTRQREPKRRFRG